VSNLRRLAEIACLLAGMAWRDGASGKRGGGAVRRRRAATARRKRERCHIRPRVPTGAVPVTGWHRGAGRLYCAWYGSRTARCKWAWGPGCQPLRRRARAAVGL